MSTHSTSRTIVLIPPVGPVEIVSGWHNWRSYFRWMGRYSHLLMATAALAIIIFSIVFAHRLTPYDPTGDMDLYNRYVPPFWEAGGSMEHPMGTDNMGRDVLSRTLYGGRVSLRVAFSASTIATAVGISLGLIAGFLGGIIDRFLMMVIDIWVSFPFMVGALAVIAVVGSSQLILITLLAFAAWVYPARVTRAQVLKVRKLEFVQASIALGASKAHIVLRHIVPNVISINILMWTLSVGTLIVIEGSLSFLGLGVNPPTPSWGNMLNDGKYYIQDAWWLTVVPGTALMLTVLCVNSLGDALQRLNNSHK